MGRTSKNIKLKIPEKPRKIKGFRSGSCRIATTISSQSRYDHFDTSPYLSQHQHLRKRGELMGRTSKNIKLKIPEKPRKIKGFRSGSCRIATTISSRARYDRFDTSPFRKYSVFGTDNMISSAAPSTTRTTLHMSIRKSFPKLLEKTDGKNCEIFGFSNCGSPQKHWILGGQN